jgi:type IV pilus assembly protein PilZ
MPGRVFQRIPYVVQVEFRTASSFLVAYSINLSRGGMFLETDYPVPIGTEIPLQLAVPGHGTISLSGRVMWRRNVAGDEGPVGLGVEFQEMSEEMGQVIDRLVTQFKGLRILVMVARPQDQASITRHVRSVLSTAEVVAGSDFAKGRQMFTSDIDVAIVEGDSYTDLALDLIRHARSLTPPIPIIGLAARAELRAQLRAAGADEVTRNPPPFDELQLLLVRALGRPVRVRGEVR